MLDIGLGGGAVRNLNLNEVGVIPLCCAVSQAVGLCCRSGYGFMISSSL